MSENYSKLEMALMELDRAVTGLSKQAGGVAKTIQAAKARPASSRKAKEPDLFSMLSAAPVANTRPNHDQVDFDYLERKLDAAITQVEDMLNEESLVAGHG